jgi:hypothetical protein
METTMNRSHTEMPKIPTEKSEMSSVELFAQDALQNYIAPKGKLKDRLRKCATTLGWSHSRVNDVWYADPRITIRGRELVQIEQVTGLRYGRKELKEIDAYINRASALLEGPDEDFHRPFIAAMRAFFGALDRTGTEG